MIFINPYKKGSAGARSLRSALVSKGFRTLIGHKAPLSRNALIVNWGNSAFDYDVSPFACVINHPSIVGLMTNKKTFFQKVGHSEQVPEWATEPAGTLKWDTRVVVRHKLEASGGAGIEIVEQGTILPRAPLYVKYENKTHEFRLHMGRGLRSDTDFEPLLIQRKIFQKRPGMEQPRDWSIRNHDNGFIFVRESSYPTPKEVIRLAKDFMKANFPQLHFAALDVIWHEKKKRGWVLEGNTAPGLEGNTIDVYSGYVAKLAKEAGA